MKDFISERWICIQKQSDGNYWYFEPSLSYTRKDSIENMISGSSFTWRQLKEKYYWSCIKVQFSLKPLTK
jgi:hypothetical protein